MMARYCIGADAFAINQLMGKRTGPGGGGGGANTGTVGVIGAVNSGRPVLNHCQTTGYAKIPVMRKTLTRKDTTFRDFR